MKKLGFLVISCALLLCGCSSSQTELKQEQQKDSIKIGMSFDSMVIERWQRDRDVFISKAEELGAEVYIQNANGDVKEQISQIEYFIEQGMDVIVVNSVDDLAEADVLKKAKKQGIAIIAYDRLVKNANVDLYISFDNTKVGELMAQSLVDRVPAGGNIIAIFGSLSDHNVEMAEAGFYSVIDKSNLHVINKVYADNWLAETAFNTVTKSIENKETFDGIYCGNDDLAGQAIKALSEARLAGSVVVVGQDADLVACQRIVEGTQAMTVYKDLDMLAKDAATFAVELAKKEPLHVTETINDGTYNVPYYKLDPVAVTKENMDSVIIDGGFHLKEEVYMNLSGSSEKQ